MADGLAVATANAILNAIGNNTAYSVTTLYVQLHTGDPGSAGTANIAGNATRKAVSFGVAASGSMSNDADVSWTDAEVDTSEDYTDCSFWDAVSGGNHVGNGTVTANAVDASGDTFDILTGGLVLSFSTV